MFLAFCCSFVFRVNGKRQTENEKSVNEEKGDKTEKKEKKLKKFNYFGGKW